MIIVCRRFWEFARLLLPNLLISNRYLSDQCVYLRGLKSLICSIYGAGCHCFVVVTTTSQEKEYLSARNDSGANI